MKTSDTNLRIRTRKRTLLLAVSASALLIAVGSGIVLANGNPFAKYPPAKAAILQREQNEIATARAETPAPKNPNYTPPTSPPQPTPVAGIYNIHSGPFSACTFTVNDSWQGPVAGKWFFVYAGSDNHDTATCGDSIGALAIFSQPIGGYYSDPMASVGTFTAPTGVTSLTITAVNGEVMTVRTNTGTTLTFNLSTLQFVTPSN